MHNYEWGCAYLVGHAWGHAYYARGTSSLLGVKFDALKLFLCYFSLKFSRSCTNSTHIKMKQINYSEEKMSKTM